MTFRISTPEKEGVFQAAKWLKVQALLSGDELSALLNVLSPFTLLPLSGAYALSELPLSSSEFVRTYQEWLQLFDATNIGPYRALLLTKDDTGVWLQQMPSGHFLVKPSAPFIQIQVHHMIYSPIDQSFRPMALGKDTIFWGLQFSFPQVYQDPKTGAFVEEDMGPNEEAFRVLRRWVREHTIATPMWVEGKRVNLPIRIGKECLGWVNEHPKLREKRLEVMYAR